MKLKIIVFIILCINSFAYAQVHNLSPIVKSLSSQYGEGSVQLSKALADLAAEYEENRSFYSALYLYEKALSENDLEEDSQTKVKILHHLVLTSLKVGDSVKSLEYAHRFRAFTIENMGENSFYHLQSLLLLDNILDTWYNDSTEVLKNLESILAYYEKNDIYSDLWFNTLSRLCNGLQLNNQVDKAIYYLNKYRNGITESRKENTPHDVYGYLLSYYLFERSEDVKEAYNRWSLLPDSPEKEELEYLLYLPAMISEIAERESIVNLSRRYVEISKKKYGDNSKYYAKDLCLASNTLLSEKKNDEAIKLLTEAKEIVEENSEGAEEIYLEILYKLGDTKWALYDLESAIFYYKECEQIAAVDQVSIFPELYYSLAETYIEIGNPISAFDYLRKADRLVTFRYGNMSHEYAKLKEWYLRYYVFVCDFLKVQSLISDIIFIYEYTGETAEANRFYAEAISILANISPEDCDALIKKQGIPDTDISITNRQIRLNLEDIIFSLSDAAAILFEAGFNDTAKQLAHTAKASFLKEGINNPLLLGGYLLRIGVCDCFMKNDEDGLSELKTGLEHVKDCFGEENSSYTNGLLWYAKALYRVGNQKRKREAIEIMYESQRLFSHISNNTIVKLYNLLLAFTYQYDLEGQIPERKIEDYLSSFREFASNTLLNVTEEERKRLFDNHPKIKNLLFNLDSTNVSTIQLYNYSLLHKGLLLNSGIEVAKAILNSNDPELIRLYHNFMAIKNRQSTSISHDLESNNSITSQLDSLERELLSAYRNLSGSKVYTDYTFFDIQNALNKNDVALEFISYSPWKGNDTEKVCYDVLVAKKGWSMPKRIHLFDSDQIRKYTGSKYSLYDSNKPASHEMFNLIWGPLIEYFESGTVYFAPSEEISLLAIEYLPLPDGRPISEAYSIKRISSTKEVCTLAEPNRYKTSVLYGGLTYSMTTSEMMEESKKYQRPESLVRYSFSRGSYNDKWESLSGTEHEVNNIKSYFNSHKIHSTVFSGNHGSEESFKSLSGQNIDILHIATHGFFIKDRDVKKAAFIGLDVINIQQSPEMAMQTSGLILSGANAAWSGNSNPICEDGILTAKEISNLDFSNVDLVVLSACETGLGSVSDEGVYGLQRAFKMAGVNTIIMSLWQVDDDATLLLMTEFYKNILNGQPKRRALEKAITKVRNFKGKRNINGDVKIVDYSDPFYWAPFIMLD